MGIMDTCCEYLLFLRSRGLAAPYLRECYNVLLSSGTALTALLAMVAHIHTPPLSEKGAPGQSTQVPGQPHGGRGSEGVGLPVMSVLGALRVFHCVPFIRLIRSCFGAALGFKTRGNKKVLRIYGFEGESGGRGGWGRASPNQIIAGRQRT